MNEIQSKILDKAFAGKWITFEDVRAFGEEDEKEFGRIKRGIIGAGLGAGAGAGIGALGSVIGGSPELGVGSVGVGAALGAGLGALTRDYMVVYLNNEGYVNCEGSVAINKKDACKKLKEKVPGSSQVRVFKQPEEDELARSYISELRRGKRLFDKFSK